MSKVFTHMTMSLDGFIAGPDDGILLAPLARHYKSPLLHEPPTHD